MSASSMPLPIPPRTPTPPSDNDLRHSPESLATPNGGLGVYNVPSAASSTLSLDPFCLSPVQTSNFASVSTPDLSVTAATPTMDGGYPLSPTLEESESGSLAISDAPLPNPFSFQPSTYQPLKSPAKSHMGQRRGHKYKHSSVSHQIFLEPEPRAPLRLPASLPVPTAREGWRSMTIGQAGRLGWCFVHLCIAAFVQWTAQGSLALTALSHLIFYDAIGAFLSSSVEVLSNFEVWKRSSLRQPFGLERSEVLVGFAMSILLLFMGFDLISHNAAHILAETEHGEHDHRAHHHAERLSPGTVDMAVVITIGTTLISALVLRNHERIAKSMKFASISFLPSILSNPSHLLTLSCSALLLLMPLMSIEFYTPIDRILSTAMACAMSMLGGLLVRNLGAMLLMSYNGSGINEVIALIEQDPIVSKVEEAKFWQVHYNLCMANLKLRVRGSEENMTKLRERIQSLVRTKLGGGFGKDGGQVWEISTQLSLEKD